jgi:hypothetical protein
MWAHDKLSDRLTTEHSIRLELEEDCLIVGAIAFASHQLWLEKQY